MSLKQKTVSGLVWSFIDTIAGQGMIFIVDIILLVSLPLAGLA